jgi:hypothetical protein
LFYYKFPSNAFNDSDGNKLYLLVSQSNGSVLPDWLSYEDITSTLSGIADTNTTDLTIMVLADDLRGGTAQ